MPVAKKTRTRKVAVTRLITPPAKTTAYAPKDIVAPKKATLGENELGGLFAEAFEAYDMADERVRFDSRNRRWLFRPDKYSDHSVLTLQLKRLEDVREDRISTHILASDMGREMIEDVVRNLDAALA